MMILALVPAAALSSSTRNESKARVPSFKLKAVLLYGLTLIYAVGTPLLGGDMGASTMFSNLRVYTPSNHLLAPTGLLLNTTTLRIDGTTSTHVNAVHPNEATRLLSPRLRDWLQTSGHAGRQFAPYIKRTIGITVTPNDDHIAYLIPDLEVRRLVQEAYDQGEYDFQLNYTKLPSLDRVFFDSSKDPSCTLLKGKNLDELPCDPDEAPLNPGLPFLLDKALMFFSFPVPANATSPDDLELGCVC
mmetsp:Transcript_24784/g.80158  ORF Transcript_24784/g.80158 Transcript_24784/m.80158 type:complete len:245 (+) Transcript_24784:1216-1950(+)